MGKWDDPEYRRQYFRQYRARNRERLKARGAEWREKNLEKRLTSDRAYAASHREEARARAKAWYKANPERAKTAHKKWREKNKHKLQEYAKRHKEKHPNYDRDRSSRRRTNPVYQEYQKNYARINSARAVQRVAKWAKDNPKKARALALDVGHRRRARLNGAPSEAIDKHELYLRDQGRCGLCGLPVSEQSFVIDHIVPIAKGGGHVYPNVHIAHETCNKRKGAKTDWPVIWSL